MGNRNVSAEQLLAELLRHREASSGASALDEEVRRAMSWKSAEEREKLAEYLLSQLNEEK